MDPPLALEHIERARSPSHPRSTSPSPRSVRETMALTDLRHPNNAKLLELLKKVVDDVHDFKDGRPRKRLCCENGLPCTNNLQRGLVSALYALAVAFLTACTMTIVHDRVPDTSIYPPLPDLVLDNLPHIPWAFATAEIAILVLGVIMMLILILHKHRWIVFRRFTAIIGTVFMLRCVTMLVTSLSVPGTHLKCDVRVGASSEEKFAHAWRIFTHFGLSVSGVRTCGDYMFSGHTIVLTLLNYFINEYSPSGWKGLHIFTWILNCFGMFFILAAHEHYSIDVFIAFYIASRLFLYYHSLRPPGDDIEGERMRTFFPMYSYLEECMTGMVPNEFELPWVSLYKWIAAQKEQIQSKKEKRSSEKEKKHKAK